MCFYGDLGRKIAAVPNEDREGVYLFQRLLFIIARDSI